MSGNNFIRAKVQGRIVDAGHVDAQDRNANRFHQLGTNRYVIMARQDGPDQRVRNQGILERLARLIDPQYELGRTIFGRILRALISNSQLTMFGNRGFLIRLHGFDPREGSYPATLQQGAFSLIYHDLQINYDEVISGLMTLDSFNDGVLRGTFEGTLRDRSRTSETVIVKEGAFSISLEF